MLIIRLFALHTSSGADGREGGRAAATRLYSIRKVLLRHAPRPCQYETRAMCAAWEAMGTQTEKLITLTKQIDDCVADQELANVSAWATLCVAVLRAARPHDAQTQRSTYLATPRFPCSLARLVVLREIVSPRR